MKCVLINCFTSSNEMRVEPIREIFKKKGYETIYLGADFHHTKKKHIQLPDEITAVHVRGYKRNLSIQRLLSHYEFAYNVRRLLEIEKPDVIYVKFPPNSLVKEVYKYKKTNKCKVILDIFDLWPESLPLPNKIKILLQPVTNIWKGLRDDYLTVADIIITECNMYQSFLKEKLPIVPKYTVYLSKNDIKQFNIVKHNDNKIEVCYLGGINNLIDLKSIFDVLKNLSASFTVTLHIIGDGENKEKLITTAKIANCGVVDHGIIYDDNKKQQVLCYCDFGLNLMKNNVKVALSLKSIEYFRSGVAIINNLPCDTWKIIESENAGINYEKTFFSEKVTTLEPNIISAMRTNSRKVYENYFSQDAIHEKLIMALNDF